MLGRIWFIYCLHKHWLMTQFLTWSPNLGPRVYGCHNLAVETKECKNMHFMVASENQHTNHKSTNLKIYNFKSNQTVKAHESISIYHFGYFSEADLCTRSWPGTYSWRMSLDCVFTELKKTSGDFYVYLWYFMSWSYFKENSSHLFPLCFQCCCGSHNIVNMINLTSFLNDFEIDNIYKKMCLNLFMQFLRQQLINKHCKEPQSVNTRP